MNSITYQCVKLLMKTVCGIFILISLNTIVYANESGKDATIIREFYETFSSSNADNVDLLLGRSLSKAWRSYSDDNSLRLGGIESFKKVLKGIHSSIPDIKWEIKEILNDGNRFIVRSQVSGKPISPFFGASVGRSFSIMAIDIHTLENEKIVTSYHIEDWYGAIQQLNGISQGH